MMDKDESDYSPSVITQDVGKPSHQYKAQIHVAPHSLAQGIYRVICCTQYFLKNEQLGSIAGFQDLGLIKIYEDKKGRKTKTRDVALANGARAQILSLFLTIEGYLIPA